MASLASFGLATGVSIGTDVYVLKLGVACDGSAVAAATSLNSIVLLDAATLRPLRTLEGHADVVEDLQFFQSEPSCLASCSRDGTARVWDLRASGASSRAFEVGSQEVYSCTVGCGDRSLACAASEKVHLFDVAEGRRQRVYKDLHTDVINHVRFHPAHTSRLLTGAEDALVVAVDTTVASEDDAMVACIHNEECVRGFTLVGPDRETLCCASTTEDVRIWSLGEEDCGSKRAEFLGLRCHPLLAREESGGYVVETFYDQPSGQVFLLAGAGTDGELTLFRASPAGAEPIAVFAAPEGAAALPDVVASHVGVVRSALCLDGGVLVTAGEDGRVCAWREGAGADAAAAGAAMAPASGESPAHTDGPASGGYVSRGSFRLEPTAYGASRRAAGARAAPY